MDLNLIVAAGVLTLTALLIVRYAMRLGALFLMGGLFLFLIGFLGAPQGGGEGTKKPEHNDAITLPPDFVMPDRARVGIPPRFHEFA